VPVPVIGADAVSASSADDQRKTHRRPRLRNFYHCPQIPPRHATTFPDQKLSSCRYLRADWP